MPGMRYRARPSSSAAARRGVAASGTSIPVPFRAVAAGVLAGAVALLGAGCSAGSDAGVQRAAPGAVQTTLRSSADGVELSMKARNVDLDISGAAVVLDPSGTAYVRMTVRNLGPAAEHLGMVSFDDGSQATLKGDTAPVGSLSTAGVRLESGVATAFGAPSSAKQPSIALPAGTAVKAGGTEPVMLMFGIAGLVRLDLPVRTG